MDIPEQTEIINIDPNQQFTTAQIAELLGISTVSVFNRIKAGTIKAEMVAGSYMISGAEVQHILNIGISAEDTEEIRAAVSKMASQYTATLAMLDAK